MANGKSATNDLGCNPATKPVPDETWFDVTDNCKANAVATVTAGTESNDGCTHTIVYTANYTSECDDTKVADEVSVTVTWKEAEKPSIALKSGKQAINDLGCNPATKPVPDASWFKVTDNCDADAEATVTAGTESSDGCTHSIVYTANYTSECDDTKVADEVSVTVTWKETGTPTIALANGKVATYDLGCNPAESDKPVPNASWFVVTDNCKADAAATVTEGAESNDGCTHTIVYTANYTSECDATKKADAVTVTVTWKEAEKPSIALKSGKQATNDLGCNPATKPVPDETWFVVTDNCKAGAVATVTAGAENSDGCTHSIVYTANYTSECDDTKVADAVSVTVIWKETGTPTIALASHWQMVSQPPMI